MTKSISFRTGDDDITFNYVHLSDLNEEFKKRNINIGDNVYLCNGCTIHNNVVIGETSIILLNYILENTEIGSDNKILLQDPFSYIDKGFKTGSDVTILDKVIIGSNCDFGDNVIIHEGTRIGNNCHIGSYSVLLGYRCNIGSNVTIGERVTIDKNVHINSDEKIGNDIEYRSIIFNGLETGGRLVYWGTDEIILDEIQNSYNTRIEYKKYSLEEFKNQVLRDGMWPAYFSYREIGYYQKCYKLIEHMHKSEITKPRESLFMRRRKEELDNYRNNQPPDWYEPTSLKDPHDIYTNPDDSWMDGDPSNYWNID